MNYHKNEMISECLSQYYALFSQTLDTADFVPEKYNKKVLKYIFKNMKRRFRHIDGLHFWHYWRIVKAVEKQAERQLAEAYAKAHGSSEVKESNENIERESEV